MNLIKLKFLIGALFFFSSITFAADDDIISVSDVFGSSANRPSYIIPLDSDISYDSYIRSGDAIDAIGTNLQSGGDIQAGGDGGGYSTLELSDVQYIEVHMGYYGGNTYPYVLGLEFTDINGVTTSYGANESSASVSDTSLIEVSGELSAIIGWSDSSYGGHILDAIQFQTTTAPEDYIPVATTLSPVYGSMNDGQSIYIPLEGPVSGLNIKHGSAIDSISITNTLTGELLKAGGYGGEVSDLFDSAQFLQDTIKIRVYTGDLAGDGYDSVAVLDFDRGTQNLAYVFGDTALVREFPHETFELDGTLTGIIAWSNPEADSYIIDAIQFITEKPLENTESDSYETTVSDLSFDVKRSDGWGNTGSFLYTVLEYPKDNYDDAKDIVKKIALLSYDGASTISDFDTDYENLQLIECGPSEEFNPPVSGIVNYEQQTGTGSFDDLESPCHIARNREFAWMSGKGVVDFYDDDQITPWLSRDLKGNVQCLSFNGVDCVGTTIGLSEDTISIPSLGISASPDELNQINRNDDLLLAAEPLVCGQDMVAKLGINGYSDPTHWCSLYLNPSKSITHAKLLASIEHKKQHMEALFNIRERQKLHEVDKEYIPGDYRPTYIYEFFADAASVGTGISVNDYDALGEIIETGTWGLFGTTSLLFIPTCSIISNLPFIGDLISDCDTHEAEKEAYEEALKTAQIQLDEDKAADWLNLQQEWADESGYDDELSFLLKQESQKLSDLHDLKEYHLRSLEEKQQNLEEAIASYNLLNDPEALLGATVKKAIQDGEELASEIEEKVKADMQRRANDRTAFIDHPSFHNFLNVVEDEDPTGTVRSIADTAEQINETIEIIDLLKSLSDQDDLEEVLEEILDSYTDQIVHIARQDGFYVDNPSTLSKPLIISNYQNLLDLLEGSEDSSINRKSEFLASDEHHTMQAINAQLSIDEEAILQHFSDPNYFDTIFFSQTEALGNFDEDQFSYAAQAEVFSNKLSELFIHSMGHNYTDVISGSDQTIKQLNHALYEVIIGDPYAEQREAHWVDSSVLGSTPAAFIYDDTYSGIFMYWAYLEELGHMANWYRCKIYDVDYNVCQIHSDVGARFRDAMLSGAPEENVALAAHLYELPSYHHVKAKKIEFDDISASKTYMETTGGFLTLNHHIQDLGDASALFRVQLSLDNPEFSSKAFKVSDTLAVEISFQLPKPASNGNPLRVGTVGNLWTENCQDFINKKLEESITNPNVVVPVYDRNECDVLTGWLVVSIRDTAQLSAELNFDIGDGSTALNRVKGYINKIHPTAGASLVRKHMVRIPIQFTNPEGESDVSWETSYYAKSISGVVDMAISPLVADLAKETIPKIKGSFFDLSPEFYGSASVIVNQDAAHTIASVFLDVASISAGCFLGSEGGVTGCHLASDLSESFITAIEAATGILKSVSLDTGYGMQTNIKLKTSSFEAEDAYSPYDNAPYGNEYDSADADLYADLRKKKFTDYLTKKNLKGGTLLRAQIGKVIASYDLLTDVSDAAKESVD